jgi:hypothetical protein
MIRVLIAVAVVLGLAAEGPTQERPAKLPQRVLYVGNAKTPRGQAFAEFLRQQFASVEAADREGFDPKRAAQADVVVLDWSQRDPRTKPIKSPLGPREAWTKPTVLLDSAGHLLAGAWEVHGGSG